MDKEATTISSVFGFGLATNQNDESRNLLLIESDNSVVFSLVGFSLGTVTI